jgi:hypothetical protein
LTRDEAIKAAATQGPALGVDLRALLKKGYVFFFEDEKGTLRVGLTRKGHDFSLA